MMAYAGGCLCGALRWDTEAEPAFAGFCFCVDCRKASGSGFVPVMGFASAALRVRGAARQWRCISIKGTEAVRNFCAACGGLVFGGELGADDMHTVYAGSLDDAALFRPRMVIFNRDRPDWVVLPEGLALFETMPGM